MRLFSHIYAFSVDNLYPSLPPLTPFLHSPSPASQTLYLFDGLTELDMSENDLLFLPPSISKLQSLQILNLGKNCECICVFISQTHHPLTVITIIILYINMYMYASS